eukprot:g66187.t1
MLYCSVLAQKQKKTKEEIMLLELQKRRTFHYRLDKIQLEFEAKVDQCFLEFEIGGRTKEAEGQVTESETHKKVDPTTGETHEIERPVYKRQLKILTDPAQRWYSRSIKLTDPKKPKSFDDELSGTWHGSYEDLELEKITVRLWQYRLLQPNYLIGHAQISLRDVARGHTDQLLPLNKYQLHGVKAKELVGHLRFECEFQETAQYILDLRDWEVTPLNKAALLESRRVHDLCFWAAKYCDVCHTDLFQLSHTVHFNLSSQGPRRRLNRWERLYDLASCVDGCCYYNHAARLLLYPDVKTEMLDQVASSKEYQHFEQLNYTGGLSSRNQKTELKYTGAWSWLEDEWIRVELRQGIGCMRCWCNNTLAITKIDLQGVLDYGYVIGDMEGTSLDYGKTVPKWAVKGALLTNAQPELRQVSTMGPSLQIKSLWYKLGKRLQFVTPEDAMYLVVRVKSAQGLFNPLPADYSETINASVTIEWRTILKYIPKCYNNRDPYWSNGEVHFKLPHHRQLKPPERFEDFHPDYQNSQVTLAVWDNHDLSKAPLGFVSIPFEDVYNQREEKYITTYASAGEHRRVFVFHKFLPLQTHFAMPDNSGMKLLDRQAKKNGNTTSTGAPRAQTMRDDDGDDEGHQDYASEEQGLEDRRSKIEVEIYFDRADGLQVPVRPTKKQANQKKPNKVQLCQKLCRCCSQSETVLGLDQFLTSLYEIFRTQLSEDETLEFRNPLKPKVASLTSADLSSIASYWHHAIRFVPNRKNRFFPVVGRDEWSGEIYYLPCFLINLVPPRDLRQHYRVLHLVYSIECQARPANRDRERWEEKVLEKKARFPRELWIWTDPYFFLEKRKGDVRAHALLLCCFLLGLKNQGQHEAENTGNKTAQSPIEGVYVCIGTVRVKGQHDGAKPTPHVWVMTLERHNEVVDKDKRVLDEASTAHLAESTVHSSINELSNAQQAQENGESPSKSVKVTKVVRFWETTNGRTYKLTGDGYFSDKHDEAKLPGEASGAVNGHTSNGSSGSPGSEQLGTVADASEEIATEDFLTDVTVEQARKDSRPATRPSTATKPVTLSYSNSDSSDEDVLEAQFRLGQKEEDEMMNMLDDINLDEPDENATQITEMGQIEPMVQQQPTSPPGLQQDLWRAQEQEEIVAQRQEWVEVRHRLDENENTPEILDLVQKQKERRAAAHPAGPPTGYPQARKRRTAASSSSAGSKASAAPLYSPPGPQKSGGRWDSGEDDRLGYLTPYVTLDVVFNDKGLWCNLQNPDPEIISYDLHEPTKWTTIDKTSLQQLFHLDQTEPFFPVRALSSVRTPEPDAERAEQRILLRAKDSLSAWRSYRRHGRIRWIHKFDFQTDQETSEDFLKKRLKNEQKYGGGMYDEEVKRDLDHGKDEFDENPKYEGDIEMQKNYVQRWRNQMKKYVGHDRLMEERVVYFKHSDLNRLTKGLIQQCQKLLEIPQKYDPQFAMACNLERQPGQISPVRVLFLVVLVGARKICLCKRNSLSLQYS